MKIRFYQASDEKNWVYTKALSYLFSPFFDDMETEKTAFNPEIYQDSIELVAEIDQQIVGLLDIGIYQPEVSQNYLYHQADAVAYFTNLAVHPDFQRQGIAGKLFSEAKKQLIEKQVDALAIFTRESESTRELYQKWGAKLVCQDFLVIGNPKDQSYPAYQLDKEQQRLQLLDQKTNQKIPYTLQEGHYLVTDEEHLIDFDINQVIKEFTYILSLK